jgi:hypothetical protein
MNRDPMLRRTGARPVQTAGTPRGARPLTALALSLAGAALTACNFDVSNPGPVQDAFLSDTAALTAEVNGMGLSLGNALNYVILQGGVAARELFPTGQTGQFGIEPQNIGGRLIDTEQGDPWSNTQQARWLAEHGLVRMREVLGEGGFASSPHVAQAQLWAGYSNRTLGENMCEAVIDGSAPTPSTDYLTRAELHFTSAIATATAAKLPALVTPATAGRAAVRAHLGNWSGAAADAAAVPTAFVYALPYYDIGDEYQYNRTYWSSTSASFYKAHTVWNTPYEQYFTTTQDPRVRWERTSLKGNGAVAGLGAVPWYPQAKYATRTSGVRLSSGREMRLIEAEAALRAGRTAEAMATINALRSAVGVAAWPAPASAEAAWTYLKRERGVELWLEGRRLGDLRRWKAASTPGELSPLETPSPQSYLTAQDLCFPISRAERETNPNIPQS